MTEKDRILVGNVRREANTWGEGCRRRGDPEAALWSSIVLVCDLAERLDKELKEARIQSRRSLGLTLAE